MSYQCWCLWFILSLKLRFSYFLYEEKFWTISWIYWVLNFKFWLLFKISILAGANHFEGCYLNVSLIYKASAALCASCELCRRQEFHPKTLWLWLGFRKSKTMLSHQDESEQGFSLWLSLDMVTLSLLQGVCSQQFLDSNFIGKKNSHCLF